MMKNKRTSPEENQNGTLLHNKLSFAATEAYKILRTNLLFTLPDEHQCRIVGVTSSLRGEGKSTTSVNLSYTLAETGKKVLLIDGDLRLPSVAKKLDVKNAPGLSNVLVGAADYKTAILSSRVLENWYVLPAGDIPPNPSEMLGSVQMEKFIKEQSEFYDFIIIDLPPVNIVTDALVISHMIDGMIVVIREGYAERRALNMCTRQLNLSNVRILGFVMNGATGGSGSYGRYKAYRYSSKYYRRYGYYAEEPADNKKRGGWARLKTTGNASKKSQN